MLSPGSVQVVKLKLVGAVYLDNPFVVGAFGPREQEISPSCERSCLPAACSSER